MNVFKIRHKAQIKLISVNVFTSIVLRSHFLAKATDNMAEMTMTTPTMMLKKNSFILSWIS
jgi:hypothetical protein